MDNEKETNTNDEKQNINQQKIVIVSGDGKDLDISKVYDHLNIDEPTPSEDIKKEKVIIPPEKK